MYVYAVYVYPAAKSIVQWVISNSLVPAHFVLHPSNGPCPNPSCPQPEPATWDQAASEKLPGIIHSQSPLLVVNVYKLDYHTLSFHK